MNKNGGCHMNTEQLKKIVCDTIDQNRDKICEIGNSIYKNPELGFKEYFGIKGEVK